MSLPTGLRITVWKHYNGKQFEVPCYVNCGYIIDAHHFECGHVIAQSKGGNDTVENLRTISSNMEEFITKHGFKATNTLRHIIFPDLQPQKHQKLQREAWELQKLQEIAILPTSQSTLTNVPILFADASSGFNCDVCEKTYGSRGGLWKHKKQKKCVNGNQVKLLEDRVKSLEKVIELKDNQLQQQLDENYRLQMLVQNISSMHLQIKTI